VSLASAAQYAAFLAIITAAGRPLGGYLERVFGRAPTRLDRLLVPLERAVYRLTRVDPSAEMSAGEYSLCFVLFGLAGTLLLYSILRCQPLLPWFFPAFHATPLTPDLAFNTAVSFSTTTTWQAYGGESTMTYTSQMVGLCAQNFLAGGAGLAIGVAFIRGFAREHAGTLGNFWVDLTRALLWVLLPAALVGAIALVWQGVPMNVRPYTHVAPIGGGGQVIAQGPVAALEIVKNLGTNGGGFFNVNGAHPFENPTPLTNVLELLAIVLVPAALTNTFGRMTKQPRQGWLLYWAMVGLLVAGLAAVHVAEAGNMEGKEVRFGIANSALWATITTDTSCGAVNSMHDSYMPLGGMVPLINMLLGEVIVGGVGSGLYGILLFAIVALFVAGLMVGRTPEYLGKKLEAKEVKMTMLAILCLPLAILVFTAIAVVVEPGLAGISNAGPHGYTEVLYAYTEGAGNNGSAFAGLSANTPFYNTTIGFAMLVGRFFVIIPMLAIAGALAAKNISPPSAGTFPPDSGLFVGLLVGVIVIVGGLTYFPAVALGPLAEQFAMKAGTLF